MIYAGITGYALRTGRVGALGGALQYIAPAGLATLRFGTATLTIPALQITAAATEELTATGTLTLAAVGLDAVGGPPPLSTADLTIQPVRVDGTATGPAAFEGQIQSVSLDATAAAMLATAELEIAPVGIEAQGVEIPAGVGSFVLQTARMTAQGQMHAEGVGVLSVTAVELTAEEEEGEPEPEPDALFWTPREFGTTTWAAT